MSGSQKRVRVGMGIFCAAICVAPFFAGALSASDLQTQIQALLAQIAAVQNQIGAASSAAATPAPGAPSLLSSSACPQLVRTLSLGARGDDVLALQQFLIGEKLLSTDSATGYFGLLTQSAVRFWQSSHGVVSSGDSASSGYGVVGPHTRAIIQLSCSTASQPLQCPLAPQPAIICSGTWSPLTDSNGCTMAWQCAIPLPGYVAPTASTAATSSTSTNTNACTAIALSCPAGKRDQVGPNCSHTCVSTNLSCPQSQAPACTDGTLQPLGVDSAGCSLGYQCLPNVCPALAWTKPDTSLCQQGIWIATFKNGCQAGWQCILSTVTTPSAPLALSVSPASGSAPLTVTFSATVTGAYAIDFGDGTPVGALACSSTSCSSTTNVHQTHTYESVGTYTATLKNGSGSVGTALITVGNPISVTVGSGGVSLTANPTSGVPALPVQFSASGGASLDYGDGTSASCLFLICSGSIHTYVSTGTYTARLLGTSGNVLKSVIITVGATTTSTINVTLPGSVTLAVAQTATQNMSGLGTIPIFTLNSISTSTAQVTVVTAYSCLSAGSCTVSQIGGATLALHVPKVVGSEQFTLSALSSNSATVGVVATTSTTTLP